MSLVLLSLDSGLPIQQSLLALAFEKREKGYLHLKGRKYKSVVTISLRKPLVKARVHALIPPSHLCKTPMICSMEARYSTCISFALIFYFSL